MQPASPASGAPSPDMPSPGPGYDPARLIQDHQAGVWRYLRSLGCEPSLADDLTQDTFLAVLQRPFQDLGPMAVAAYLRKIAFNLLVTQHRRRGKVTAVENLEEIDAAWSRLVADDNGEELLAALRECLQKLTERARQALLMRFREHQTREAIAAMLEITEHGAKNLMQRAKQQLRTCIEKKVKSPS